MNGGALSHIRVLDLSRVLAGPWAGQILADLGAEVIKVERPGRGDDTRGWGPPYLKDAGGRDTGESAYFLSANRGKKSVAVDISKPEGQELVRRLAAESDVLIENFKVGGLARYGLDYESLSAVNPRLVYCSITGFGQDGPYRARPGYDFMIQAMGGLMSITGEADGHAGAGPQKVGVALADIITGLYSTIAIQAALAARGKHRARTARGHGALGLPGGRACQPGHELPDHGYRPAAPGQRTSQHRPLPGVCGERRAPHGRPCRQPMDYEANRTRSP